VPDVDSLDRHPAFSFLPCNRKSTIDIRNSAGGIAQLVERQLCKLEVRGSNPLASKASKAWRQKFNNRAHFRMHQRERNPLPPFFASRKMSRRSLGVGGPLGIDFRFAIFDCRFKYFPAKRALDLKSLIEIRKFSGAAASGPVAQLVRACA
jgi:hypothetical protein